MPDILHRVGIRAASRDVFKALTTIEGLSHWWVSTTAGKAGSGGTIDFGFCRMRVVAAQPDKLVKWKCISGPKEWIDTEVAFELKPGKGQTWVLFTHANWKKPVEFMRHCSTKWASFLFSLRDWLERKEGRPAPYDLKIHVGD